MKQQKTYSAKPSEVTRNWVLFDASDTTLGRLSTVVATYLTGKRKPMYTAHIDCGDHVIIVNTDKLKVTGNKLNAKIYYSHSGYPGALKERTLKSRMDDGNSDDVVRDAVKGMLPKNKLTNDRVLRLKVYRDDNHGHEAQNPQKVEVK